MRPKKAIVFKTMQMLVIFLVVLVVLLLIEHRLGEGIEKKAQKDICKASVYAAAKSPLKRVSTSADIKCPTQYVDVGGGNNEMKAQLADYLAECWDMFGEGKLDLFDYSLLETNRYCIICHHMTFDRKTDISMEEFTNYLRDNELRVGKENIPYYTYLSGYRTADLDLSAISASDFGEINTEFPYATIFTYAKRGRLNEVFAEWTLGGMGFGAALGLATLIVAPVPGTRVAAASIILGSAAGGAVTTGAVSAKLGAGVTEDWDAAIALYPYTEEAIGKLDCTYMPAIQQE